MRASVFGLGKPCTNEFFKPTSVRMSVSSFIRPESTRSLCSVTCLPRAPPLSGLLDSRPCFEGNGDAWTDRTTAEYLVPLLEIKEFIKHHRTSWLDGIIQEKSVQIDVKPCLVVVSTLIDKAHQHVNEGPRRCAHTSCRFLHRITSLLSVNERSKTRSRSRSRLCTIAC